MDLTSPELAYLIATERQAELLADAEAPPSHLWRGVVGRLKSAFAR
ncbi:MAG: hypothetical protein H0V20_09165 [Actinobacteria bacterium]|nr:hypothetical protein [Actinomycetota bacterium]